MLKIKLQFLTDCLRVLEANEFLIELKQVTQTNLEERCLNGSPGYGCLEDHRAMVLIKLAQYLSVAKPNPKNRGMTCAFLEDLAGITGNSKDMSIVYGIVQCLRSHMILGQFCLSLFSVKVIRPVIKGSSESLHFLTS